MAQESLIAPDYDAMDDASAKAAALEHTAKLAKLKVAKEAIRRTLAFQARLGKPPAEIDTGKPTTPETPPVTQSPVKDTSAPQSPWGNSQGSKAPSVASASAASAAPPAPAPELDALPAAAPRGQKRKRTGDNSKAKTRAPSVRRAARKTTTPDGSD